MKSLSYFDRLERHSAFYSPSGNGTIDEYQLKYDKNTGTEVLVKIGIRNVHEEIQSFKDASNINNILNRYLNGEVGLINEKNGIYGDFTNMPTSYADYFVKVKEAEKIFNQLPDEVKDKFDNSAEKFFLEFGTSSFDEKMSNNISNEIVDEMNIIQEDFDNAE